jgi:hypothetical protein
MDARWLRELQDRGRFFYERFPGAAAADEWQRSRDRAEYEHLSHSDRASEGEADDASGKRSWPRR